MDLGSVGGLVGVAVTVLTIASFLYVVRKAGVDSEKSKTKEQEAKNAEKMARDFANTPVTASDASRKLRERAARKANKAKPKRRN